MQDVTTAAWAEVHVAEHIMEVRVCKDVSSDDTFASFVDRAESAYTMKDEDFVLVFRIENFSGVSKRQAVQWMQLFDRVRPITEARLIGTCVSSPSPVVRTGARMFTLLHSPIKPFHVFDDYATCMQTAKRLIQEGRSPRSN